MRPLPKVGAAIEELKARRGVHVETGETTWTIRFVAGALVCEVTVPIDWCFEWFVTVTRSEGKEEVWRDWTEHYGTHNEALDAEMAADILSFVDRASKSDLLEPISLHEERA